MSATSRFGKDDVGGEAETGPGGPPYCFWWAEWCYSRTMPGFGQSDTIAGSQPRQGGSWTERKTMEITRRDLGKIALASVPLSRAFAAKMIDSKFGGVQVGAITYSFNRIASPDPEAIIKAYVEIGLGEAELMSNHCEALAGAPAMPMFGRGGGGAGRAPAGGRAPLTPEQQAERQSAMEKGAQWGAP